MDEKVLFGRGQQIHETPQATWKQHLSQFPQRSQSRLSFMTRDHHQVRYLAVRALVNKQAPVEPKLISAMLGMPLEKVAVILDELERKLFFLVRNEKGAVAWAYPMTVEATPHRLNFSTGEHLFAAWAEDAIAASFVQGQLSTKHLSVEIETQCRHCERFMRFAVGSDLKITTQQTEVDPLVFIPDVDWSTFAERTIIDSYWRNSVFFWSEEHAREYRANTKQVDGIYLTLEQCAYMTPITQGALFAFT